MVGKVVNAKVKVRYKGKAISIKNRKIEERCRAWDRQDKPKRICYLV